MTDLVHDIDVEIRAHEIQSGHVRETREEIQAARLSVGWIDVDYTFTRREARRK